MSNKDKVWTHLYEGHKLQTYKEVARDLKMNPGTASSVLSILERSGWADKFPIPGQRIYAYRARKERRGGTGTKPDGAKAANPASIEVRLSLPSARVLNLTMDEAFDAFTLLQSIFGAKQ